MTQEKNRSFLNPPKESDGTLRKNKLEPEANWFGPSQSPQEEFSENSPPPPDPHELAREQRELSEGEPTFHCAGRKERIGVPGEESVNMFTDEPGPTDGPIARECEERPGK